jgi:hypothetical protein
MSPEHDAPIKAGYIDARPLATVYSKSPCIARPDHTCGSIATGVAGPDHHLMSASAPKAKRLLRAANVANGMDRPRELRPIHGLANGTLALPQSSFGS